MPFIEIVINPQGQAQIQTKGFSGPTCRIASQFLEQALGKSKHEQLTADFHQVLESPQAANIERT